MKCKNPFSHGNARHSDILAYIIYYKNKMFDVCSKCADKISRSNREW